MADSGSDESFKSLPASEPASKTPQQTNTRNQDDPHGEQQKPALTTVERFSPEEGASLLAASNSIKCHGNTQFGSGSYENAIQTYDRALAECPSYLDFELAVLRSNIAACHLKLEEWKAAIESAEKGVECLERLEPLPVPPRPKQKDGNGQNGKQQEEPDSGVEEVDDHVAARIEALQRSGHTLDEVRKLQIKLLIRRARARFSTETWSALQGADEDYRILLSPTMTPFLSPTDLRTLRESAQKLAPKLNATRDKEMGEMMDKLKGLGNSILKPFGLSTENFQFTKDENSGGYSMNFNQNPGQK